MRLDHFHHVVNREVDTGLIQTIHASRLLDESDKPDGLVNVSLRMSQAVLILANDFLESVRLVEQARLLIRIRCAVGEVPDDVGGVLEARDNLLVEQVNPVNGLRGAIRDSHNVSP
jgi:hypothetical protein